jgi:hypothetical protein
LALQNVSWTQDEWLFAMVSPLCVLKQQEQKKKKLYTVACSDRRRHFTPLVFSVDGMCGVEASAAIKRAASLLSAKCPYSEICV